MAVSTVTTVRVPPSKTRNEEEGGGTNLPGSCRPFRRPLATRDAPAAVTVSVPVPANMAAYLKALTAVSRSAAAAALTHNPAAVLAPASVCQHRLQQRNCKSASDSYYLYRANYMIRFSPRECGHLARRHTWTGPAGRLREPGGV